jgi:5-methylcytosine-specific restriction protein A
MAQLLAHPCATPGCKGTVKHARYCENCKAGGMRERPSAAKRGYDREWRAYRINFLNQNRFCSDPFGTHKADGITVIATIVDHVQAHFGNHTKFWNPANHQALCESCHNRKTAQFDGGFGNRLYSVPSAESGQNNRGGGG